MICSNLLLSSYVPKLECKQILLIGEDISFQTILSEKLKKIGVGKIKVSSNYIDSINQFFECCPDMILVDMSITSTKSKIKVTVATNYAQALNFNTASLIHHQSEGAKTTIPIVSINKEITILELRRLIESCCESPNVRKPHKPLERLENKLFSEEIFIKIGNVLKKIPFKDIDWFGIGGKYAYLRKNGKELPLNIYLKELEQKIASDLFIRIHQSYIINAKKIESINVINNTVTIQGSKLPIGRSYKKKLFKSINYF